MNDIYYIKISELPVINSRTQKEFDKILLDYIEKFKEITMNVETISHLIATSIDYPFKYIMETINTYIRSGMLTSNLERIDNKEAFVREKIYIKSSKTLHFIYDRKKNSLKELEQTQIKEYDDKKGEKIELNDNDYLNVYLKLFYYDDFFVKKTKEKDKYLMSLTINKIEKNSYKDFLKERIEFYSLDMLSEKQIDKIKKLPENIYNRKLGLYKQNYKFLDEIKKGRGYYQYNFASNNSRDSEICDVAVEQLLDIATESIFIITTKIDSNSEIKTKSFKKIDKLRDEGKLYIRTIEGFDNKEKMSISVNQDKGYYSQVFDNMIHSKIIVVDNFFVALGSGNWFSSNRENFEDSLVIFPYNNAIKAYCPIYYPKGDYYKIFEQLVNEKNDLHELFDLYLIMKKDLSYAMNNLKNAYDELLIRKIEKSMENNFIKDFDLIVRFLKKENVNNDEFFYYLLSSDKIEKEYKEKLKSIYINRGDN